MLIKSSRLCSNAVFTKELDREKLNQRWSKRVGKREKKERQNTNIERDRDR